MPSPCPPDLTSPIFMFLFGFTPLFPRTHLKETQIIDSFNPSPTLSCSSRNLPGLFPQVPSPQHFGGWKWAWVTQRMRERERERNKLKKQIPPTATMSHATPHIVLGKLETHNKPESVWNNKTGCGRVVLTGRLAEPGQRESMHS